MTKKVEILLNMLRDKSYKNYRTCNEQQPILYPNDFFGFHFGLDKKCGNGRGNLTPNYKRIMEKGFDTIREEIVEAMCRTNDQQRKAYGQEMLNAIEQAIKVCDDFRERIKESGNSRLLGALQKVPHHPAESFFEACLFMKICLYLLRASNVSHLGLGRFDQYMYSYYKSDKEKGVSDEEIFETLEAFFVSINFNTKSEAKRS